MKIKDLKGIAKEMIKPMTKAGLVCLGSGALLNIALSLGQCSNPETAYSQCRIPDDKPWRGLFQGEAGVDQWSPYVLLKRNNGYLLARTDTSGRFNLIEVGGINSIDEELNAYTHPDSAQALKRAWHEIPKLK